MSRRGRVHSDSGDTLIEVLVGITIMAIAFVGILAGMGVTIAGSAEHRGLADSQTLVRNAVEQIKHQTFDGCAGVLDTQYTATATAGYHLDITTVAVWRSTTADFQSGASMAALCAATPLQKIRVRACPDDIVSAGACPAAGSQTLVMTRRDDA